MCVCVCVKVGSTHCTEGAGRYLQTEVYSELQLRHNHRATVNSLERDTDKHTKLFQTMLLNKKSEAVEVTKNIFVS